jgi:hypothetical protein
MYVLRAGGASPVDPASAAEGAATDATRRLDADAAATSALAGAVRLADVHQRDFDAVFYPGVRACGGHVCARDSCLVALTLILPGPQVATGFSGTL